MSVMIHETNVLINQTNFQLPKLKTTDISFSIKLNQQQIQIIITQVYLINNAIQIHNGTSKIKQKKVTDLFTKS